MSSDLEPRSLRARARAACLDALTALGGVATRRELVAAAERVGAFSAADLSWALTHLKREGLVENPERAVWRLARRESVAPPGVLLTSLSTSTPGLLARIAARRRSATTSPAR